MVSIQVCTPQATHPNSIHIPCQHPLPGHSVCSGVGMLGKGCRCLCRKFGGPWYPENVLEEGSGSGWMCALWASTALDSR